MGARSLFLSMILAGMLAAGTAGAQQGQFGGSWSYGQQGQYPPPQGQPYPPPQGQYPPPQGQPYPPPQGQYPQGQPYPPPQAPPKASSESSLFEIGTLYATSVGYGVGLGIWLDAEVGLTDPGVLLIPPAILGLAAPVGVYFLDHPSMPRGKPSAISAGLLIGAAEGLGIASTQFVTADKADAWGFRGLARSVAIGATLGGAAGYVVGETQEPSPKLSAFVTSGVVWGTLIGSSFGYGISPAGAGFGGSNDYAAVGGLIGLNIGLLGTAGVSLVAVPSWNQITGMWIGSGVGAAASLPVFLFYAGDSTPPAKRGLVFTGTAITLGILAGAVFSSGEPDVTGNRSRLHVPDPTTSPGLASVTSVTPFTVPGGGGLSMSGILY